MSSTAQDEDTQDEDTQRIMLGLLQSVERDGGQSQRRLAAELGIALGLVNAYLKRCIKKGLVKVSEAPARRYAYYLTPHGFAEKSRLTVEYLGYSFSFFRQARAECAEIFSVARSRAFQRVVVAGVSDLAEIARICALESGIEIVAMVDAKASSATFVGVPVVVSYAAERLVGTLAGGEIAPGEIVGRGAAERGTTAAAMFERPARSREMAAPGERPQVVQEPRQRLAESRQRGRMEEGPCDPVQADDVRRGHEIAMRAAVAKPHRREYVAPAVGIGLERAHVEPCGEVRAEPAGDQRPCGHHFGVVAALVAGVERRGDAEIAQAAMDPERGLVGAAAAVGLGKMEDAHGRRWCGTEDCGLAGTAGWKRDCFAGRGRLPNPPRNVNCAGRACRVTSAGAAAAMARRGRAPAPVSNDTAAG